MKFSIIIPNYNKAPFIKETLNSLSNQSYKDWEAIIVDDGSTDESEFIIKEFVINDKRFKFYKRTQKPKGGSVCRNIGLEKSKGEYIIFLDSDDILSENCLERRFNIISKNIGLDFAVFPSGTFYSSIGDSSSYWIPKSSGSHLKLFLAHTLPWNITSVIWKRNFILSLNGFNESFDRLQDVELHTRALLQKNIRYKVFEGAPDFYYRIDENRKGKQPNEFLLIYIYSVHKYHEFFSDYLTNNNLKSYHKYLKGTIQSAYIAVQNNYDVGAISLDDKNNLFKIIEKIKINSCTLSIYKIGLKLNLHKLKGYNLLMKKLILSF